MAFDTGIFNSPTGSLRIFTLILGAIVVGLAADSYQRGVEFEDFFFWTAVILLIVSAILVVVAILGITKDAVLVAKGDYAFHLIGGLVLLVASCLMLYSVADTGNSSSRTGKYVQRIAAGAIGVINALVYCSFGGNNFRTSNWN